MNKTCFIKVKNNIKLQNVNIYKHIGVFIGVKQPLKSVQKCKVD